jgi:glycosyltransferase involved in cell wall biosynthesis
MGKDKNLYEIFIDRFLALFSQGIICNSYKAANNLRKYNFNKKNIFTIHNGINVGDFLSERNCGSENNLIPDTSSSRIVGTIGRLCPQKNHRLFLEAAQIVTTKFMSKTTPPHPCLLPQGERGSIISPPLRGGDKGEGDACGFTNDRSSIKKSKNENLTFLIVGGGTLTPELENYSKNLGIEKYVVFTGERSDIPDLLRRMDIFVMTSFYEGLSNTIMEAMLAGLPVVATDVGGNNELVINGETGFLCPSNDAVAVADKILRLLENTQKAKQMGENGKNRIISEFKIEKMVEETETVYTTLIKQFLKSEKLVMELR